MEVIKARLGFDDLYLVSTLHGFLWGEISRFHNDIREALRESRIPALLEKLRKMIMEAIVKRPRRLALSLTD